MRGYDIEAIARGTVEVETARMSPMQALQLGLAVRDYQEQNDLAEKDFKIDYDHVGKFMSGRNK